MEYEVYDKELTSVFGNFTLIELIGRYDTKEEALQVINEMDLKEGHEYVISYNLPDMY